MTDQNDSSLDLGVLEAYALHNMGLNDDAQIVLDLIERIRELEAECSDIGRQYAELVKERAETAFKADKERYKK